MSDLIDRQMALAEVARWRGYLDDDMINRIQIGMKRLPAAQPPLEEFEWCTDCKEYDKEKHCCPRWNKVIRQTLAEAQPQRMRGRWIESNLVPSRKGKPDGRLFICSECNKGWVKQDRSMKGINFCPNCGSYNGGEQDD